VNDLDLGKNFGNLNNRLTMKNISVADELQKLNDLKEKGIR